MNASKKNEAPRQAANRPMPILNHCGGTLSRLKLGLVMLTACLAVFFSACSGGDEKKTADDGKTRADTSAAALKDSLVYVNYRDIRDLNPHLYGGEMYAQNLLFESLVKITAEGIKPWLAESWDISDDGRIYTFHLRKDVSFSDGYKFDAHAVQKNFDAVMANKDRHTWLDFVRLIDKLETVDDYTFHISLTEPYFPILIDLAVTRPFRFVSPNCMKDGQTKDGLSCYVGTNAYYLKENHIDQYAVFERNENYWGPKPAIKTIISKVIPDNQARVMALENGELDLIFGTNMIDPPTLNKFEKMKGFSTAMSDPVGTRMILFNTRDDGALKELAVRRAIQHAVNRQAVSQGIFEGTEAPADTVMAPSLPYCGLKLPPYEYDPAKAVALLEEAGWLLPENGRIREKNGLKLSTRLYYDSNSVTEKTISEFLQDEMAKIGLALEIFGEEEQSYRDRQKAGQFGMVFNISWGTPYDPQAFLAAMKLPVYGDYIAQQGLSQKTEIDERIAKALISSDLEERQAHFSFVLTALHDEAVYLPLTYERNRAVFKEGLKNVTFNVNRHETPLEKMRW